MNKIYDYITKPTLERPWPLMVQYGTHWRSNNQISTYELISNIVGMLSKYPARATNYEENQPFHKLCANIDNIVRENNIYGLYANNNKWSPIMTNKELEAFCLMVYYEWEKSGKYTYK